MVASKESVKIIALIEIKQLLKTICISHIYCRLTASERKKKNVFSNLKKNERDKKKLQETVLKQLRSLVNGQNSLHNQT